MKQNKFLTFYRSFEINKIITRSNSDIKTPQLMIFSLISGLLSLNGTCTIYDVAIANNGINGTLNRSVTDKHVSLLYKAGYINKNRSKQHFSRTYLTLTEKGLLLKSRLNNLLNTPIVLPEE